MNKILLKLNFNHFFTYMFLILGSIFVYFPIYWTLITSFKLPISIINITYIPWFDFQPSLHAWKAVSEQAGVFKGFSNGIIVSLVSSLIAVILGSMAAYGLTRFKYKFFKFRNHDLTVWIISQRFMPPIVVVLAFLIMFIYLGIIDTLVGLIIAYLGFNISIIVWLLKDFFKNIPIEIEESAQIEGASRLRIYWSIIFPISIPAIVASFIICFILTWNEFLFALILTYQEAGTVPLLLAAQVTNTGIQWWRLSVLAIMSLVPSIICAVILEKYMNSGLFSGSVK
jgi:multiple sugar transport system permease protein